MPRRVAVPVLILFGSGLIGSCREGQAPASPDAGLPNPASVFCEQSGAVWEAREEAGGQVGICRFADGSECEEWAYYRGECAPAGQVEPVGLPTDTPVPTLEPTADTEGWYTFENREWGFSFLLPQDWVAEEITSDSTLSGHLVNLRPQDAPPGLNIQVTYRHPGEDVLLWPTGVGAGEFVPQGTLDVAGAPVSRILFVCPTGETQSVWYHGSDSEPSIRRGDLEFGLIVTYAGVYCEPGYSLEGKDLALAEAILATLSVR